MSVLSVLIIALAILDVVMIINKRDVWYVFAFALLLKVPHLITLIDV